VASREWSAGKRRPRGGFCAPGLFLRHLAPRRLENLTLAFRQALDAVRRNFIENGIDFFDDKIGGWQILDLGLDGTPPELRLAGPYFD